jgi:sugar lactone lactonase YvrE
MKSIILLWVIVGMMVSGCRLSAASPPTATRPAIANSSATLTATPIETTAPPIKPQVSPTPSPTTTTTPSPTLEPSETALPSLTASATQTLPAQKEPLQAVLYTISVLPGTITGLYATQDGAIWLVSDQGFAWLREDHWEVQLQDLASQLVWVDALGRVWAVNEEASQISRWQDGEWATFGEEQGWQPLTDWFAHVGGSQTDSLGQLWLATSQDVRVCDGESWQSYIPDQMNMPDSQSDDLVPEFTLQVLVEDQVWVGSCDWGGPGPFGGRGIRWFDGDSWQGADSPVASGCVTQIESDNRGRVWAALEDELWRYTPASGDWVRFRAPAPQEATRYGFANDMVVDQANSVWIVLSECGGASCFGATAPFRIQNGSWEAFAERDPAGTQRLALDGSDTVWLFSESGISGYHQDGVTQHAELYTQQYVVDADGKLWLLTWEGDQTLLWVTRDQ